MRVAGKPVPRRASAGVGGYFSLEQVGYRQVGREIALCRETLLENLYLYGRRGTTCGVNSGRLLGKVSVPMDLAGTESRLACFTMDGFQSAKTRNARALSFTSM